MPLVIRMTEASYAVTGAFGEERAGKETTFHRFSLVDDSFVLILHIPWEVCTNVCTYLCVCVFIIINPCSLCKICTHVCKNLCLCVRVCVCVLCIT
jgi:hypothetical protein